MARVLLPSDARAAFERDGYYVFRGLLDPAESTLRPAQELMEDKVDTMAAKLAAARVAAGAPARSAHVGAPFESRWARLARDFAEDCRGGALPSDQLALISAGSWGRSDMLDPRVHDLITHDALLAVARLLLGPEVLANGDYYFRPAVSDLIVDWGLEYHQDSFNYGGDIHAEQLSPRVKGLQVLTLWLPLVPVNHRTGTLSLVKGSHRRGKIWPATIATEDRDSFRKTTFSDLAPRMPVVDRREPQRLQEYKSSNWPEGVRTYGEVVAPALQPGDVLAFHNLLMHGTSPHLQMDTVVSCGVRLRFVSYAQLELRSSVTV
eukprot:COSAG02_NODE_1532_length_12086_cov_6.489447_6_plen_320_part_00